MPSRPSFTLYSIDNQKEVHPNLPTRAYKRLTFLQSYMRSVPIFLVGEDTIDALYHTDRTGINPHCLKDKLLNDTKIFHQSDILWRFIAESDCCSYKLSPLGLYVYKLSEAEQQDLINKVSPKEEKKREEMAPFLKGPAIFLCPDRIFKDSSNGDEELIFEAVLIHELVHAYKPDFFWSRDFYQQEWGRLIEESLANAISLLHFRPEEQKPLEDFMKRQPLEYAAYDYWLAEGYLVNTYVSQEAPAILEAWREISRVSLSSIVREWRRVAEKVHRSIRQMSPNPITHLLDKQEPMLREYAYTPSFEHTEYATRSVALAVALSILNWVLA